MKRGRKPNLVPHKRLNVYVEEALYAEFQILHFDNRIGRPQFGAFSELMNKFLREYLKQKRSEMEKVNV